MLSKRIENLVGQSFNYLTIVEFAGTNRHRMAMWKCRCVCGNYTILTRGNILSGNTKSCGCKTREMHTTHGHKTTQPGKNYRGSATYNCWSAMKHRCTNSNNKHYKDYGGRGITVCDEWMNSFESFLRDMGEKPEGMSIDRIKNELGYFKENCHWIPLVDQQSNRRNNRNITVNGETRSVSQWSRKTRISTWVICQRLNRNVPTDHLFDPVEPRKKKS